MNFLVTGGAGFIGSHVCERLLRDGHRVWAFDDLNSFYNPKFKQRNLHEIQALAPWHNPAQDAAPTSKPAYSTGQAKPFEFVHGDITDAAALAEIFSSVKFDQVIHLAARAGVRSSLADPALYQRVNVEGTVNVLEAARKNGVKKITIASSSSVYGLNSKVPFSESDVVNSPISPYAASKLACESLGHVWHHIHKMDVAMLRFFTVYGQRQRPDLAIYKFAELMSAGQPIPVFGDGNTARDYTFVADTLEGIIACTQREFGFEVFNLGESQIVKLSYLIELLEAALGCHAVIDRQPMQPGDVPITFADISKARDRLGYQPQVKIEQGIKMFADWFKKSQNRS